MTDNRLRKFIIKQVAGDLVYDAEGHCIHLTTRQISETKRQSIIDEAAKYEYSATEAEKILRNTLASLNDQYAPLVHTESFINIQDLAPGCMLQLLGATHGLGVAKLDLLYLGKKKAQHLFFVVNSHRKGLKSEDIVIPIDDRIWSVQYPLFFKVLRDGQRFPSTGMVYRTYDLTQITVYRPGIVHQVIDSIDDFRWTDVVETDTTARKLSLGANPLNLLFNVFCNDVPLRAKVDNDGNTTYKSVPDYTYPPSEMREKAFAISNTFKQYSVRLTTTQEGELEWSNDGVIKIVKKAAVEPIEDK